MIKKELQYNITKTVIQVFTKAKASGGKEEWIVSENLIEKKGLGFPQTGAQGWRTEDVKELAFICKTV